MKFVRFTMSLSLVVLLIIGTAPTTNAQYPKWFYGATGFAKALEVQRELNVSLVVYFYTDWCPYCRTLNEQYLSSPAVHRALQRTVAVRINPEYGPEELQIAQRFGVVGYPTFLIMDNEFAQPRDIQPFRKGGHHLTPEQFARECEKAMTFLPIPKKTVRDESRAAIDRESTRAVMNATRQTRSAQIVEVRSGKTVTPAAIKNIPLPPIDTILSKYVDAIGGRAANERVKSRVIKGKVELSGAESWGQLSIYAKAPNKSLTIMNVGPMGQVKHGYDGCNAWNVGDTIGSQNLTGAALSSFSAGTDFYREIKLDELYPGIRLMGRVKEKDRELYMVEGYPAFGSAETMYFEVESGLLTGRDLTQQTPRGPIRVEMRYSDWRVIDGVKLPFKITQLMPNLKFIFTVREVKHNLPLEDKFFAKA
jgi:thiol-disulfide isomerase/thioredoxin